MNNELKLVKADLTRAETALTSNAFRHMEKICQCMADHQLMQQQNAELQGQLTRTQQNLTHVTANLKRVETDLISQTSQHKEDIRQH